MPRSQLGVTGTAPTYLHGIPVQYRLGCTPVSWLPRNLSSSRPGVEEAKRHGSYPRPLLGPHDDPRSKNSYVQNQDGLAILRIYGSSHEPSGEGLKAEGGFTDRFPHAKLVGSTRLPHNQGQGNGCVISLGLEARDDTSRLRHS